MSWFLLVLQKYAVFDGRARRKEYWMFTLFNMLVYFALFLVGFLLFGRGGDSGVGLGMVPALLWALAMLLPALGVTVRRLHDTGKSGWWMLIAFVPLASIALLVFACMDSEPGTNQYGPNPKLIAGPSQI